jgi:hypothetical protein
MGFFDKIKENLSHGGINVVLTSPPTTSLNDAALPITVTLTNNEQPRIIKSITAEVLANSKDSAVDMFRNDARNQSAEQNYEVDQKVAVSHMDQPFQLEMGETKSVTINIPLNPTLNQQGQSANSGMFGEAMGLLAHMNAYGASFSQGHLKYSIRVTANIDGIVMGPSAEKPIQLVT